MGVSTRRSRSPAALHVAFHISGEQTPHAWQGWIGLAADKNARKYHPHVFAEIEDAVSGRRVVFPIVAQGPKSDGEAPRE